jgi:hypothetical protein
MLNIHLKYFSMAGAEGFEPSNNGSKVRCLTTWRRPNAYYFTDLRREVKSNE